MKKILFISYDGLSDPLGQSQIIPYLSGLANSGFEITILTCEKKDTLEKNKEEIKKKLDEKGIEWQYSRFHSSPPAFSTMFNFFLLKRKAFLLQKKKRFEIVHCRSYISSLIGLKIKKRFGLKFIFDMRGFWADERVEGGLWNLKNPFYKFIYNYFKKKEIEFFAKADFTVSLTKNAKEIIHSRNEIFGQPIPIEIIPCCVDFDLFSPKNVNIRLLEEVKIKQKIGENDFVISYLGAIGTWYLLDEMLLFFKELMLKKANAKFLFISGENPKNIFRAATRLDIPNEAIIVQKASRVDVPTLLSLSKVSVFFIKPCFSKKASSPTKMGEIMAMGIPFICNGNIGDIDQIIENATGGIMINDFNAIEYCSAIDKLDALLKIDKELIIRSAKIFFSLEKGVNSYHRIYEKLATHNYSRI